MTIDDYKPREVLIDREPLEVGKTYKIKDVLEVDNAILNIPSMSGKYSSLFCRDNYTPKKPTVVEIFKDAEDKWTSNQISQDIDPETEVEVVGFYKKYQ